MRQRSSQRRPLVSAISCAILCCIFCTPLQAQTDTSERIFPQSKAAIEKALRAMQLSMSGRLPVLDGFANPGEHPLDRYQRGYFQVSAKVMPVPGGGSAVRIAAKVTAWYADPVASRSGYQLLLSNGRLESDILDQLAAQLAAGSSASTSAPVAPPDGPAKESEISAPVPVRNFPDGKGTISSSLSRNLPSEARPNKENTAPPAAAKKTDPLQAEADNLEEILKNTAHPKNLVAVKKSGTPVVASPSLTAKPQFLASQHDEFEMLDFNADWVHVRISGLSRGWIWRNSVEMPDGIPDTATGQTPGLRPAADLFRVVREEVAAFPGDWEPLRSKNVTIISVQKVDETAKNTGPKERLEYAKYLLSKSYPEIAKKHEESHGIVVIFDSADGGMIAAPASALQQWKAGALSDSALWHKCFFDPPETFDSAAASGSK